MFHQAKIRNTSAQVMILAMWSGNFFVTMEQAVWPTVFIYDTAQILISISFDYSLVERLLKKKKNPQSTFFYFNNTDLNKSKYQKKKYLPIQVRTFFFTR